MRFVDVVLDLPSPAGNECFTYILPSEWEGSITIGSRVLVPFGSRNRSRLAVVIAIKEKATVNISFKTVTSPVDLSPIYSEESVALAIWTARRYISTPWKVLEAMLPTYARITQKPWIYKKETTDEALILELSFEARSLYNKLKTSQELNVFLKEQDFDIECIKELEKKNLVQVRNFFRQRGDSRKRIVFYALCDSLQDYKNKGIDDLLANAPKQNDLLKKLIVDGPQDKKTLNRFFKRPGYLLKALEAKGLIGQQEVSLERIPDIYSNFVEKSTHELNQAQRQSVQRIAKALEDSRHQSFLLFGITGSGKTDVYLELTEKTLKMNRDVLLLVPEISLTSQLVGRFSARFGSKVTFIHSHLSDGERYDVWNAIRNREKRVVIGARSAVFAPLDHLGLVIVDEAHDGAYKQGEPEPRYHARVIAEKRAQMNKAVFIAGSATPALETFYRCEMGSIEKVELLQRAGSGELPSVEIIDMRNEWKLGNKGIFSKALTSSLEDIINKNKQAILFMNKRGFSSAIVCRECGTVFSCPQCDIALCYHKQHAMMRCHYCDYLEPLPQKCFVCGSTHLDYQGTGIEQVEDYLKFHFPQLASERLDSDSTRQKNSFDQILGRFKSGETQVLIGTQMVAKGLDFPNVLLVGIIDADIGLHIGDIRASEKTFQQITQVAGRAGRGYGQGHVIIQTRHPTHPAIVAAAKQDYLLFYNQEKAVRNDMNYPPFGHMLRILVSDFDERKARQLANEMSQKIRNIDTSLEILGPSPAPIERIRNRYRVQIIIKSLLLKKLLSLGNWVKEYGLSSRISKNLRVLVDIDPENVL